jgi:predicted molibdopterin-dependent oxidoreductase YjgC
LSEPGEGKAVAGLCSATATCEEIHLFDRLLRELAGSTSPWYGSGGRIDPREKEDFLRRSDPNPNTRGLDAILEDPHPLADLLERMGQGGVGTLLVVGSVLDDETARAVGAVPNVVVIGSHRGPAIEASTVALPGAVWLEKEGTFVNGDGHLQRFLQALDIATGARPDALILSTLIAACGFGEGYEGPEAIFAELAVERMPFFGLSYRTIPAEGVALVQTGAEAENAERGAGES